MDITSVLKKNKSELALVVGNGIHRYSGMGNSWEGLLQGLANKYKPGVKIYPRGISLTEYYDVLELNSSKQSLQREFCDLLDKWEPAEHHHRVVNWALRNSSPILTTNFDKVLADCGGFKKRRTKKEKFTAYYPWDTYFGQDKITNPCKSFGVWHINGMQEYRQSIRLGLSHYMGSVQRARVWLHRYGNRLFSGKSHNTWRGADTWLQVIFSSQLLIFGLGLEENEVFLRWLLIERARYFREYPKMRKQAWFVHVTNGGRTKLEEGKQFFLEGVGIKVITVDTYDKLYSNEIWGSSREAV